MRAFREPERVGIDFVRYEAKDFAKGAKVSDADVEQEYNTFKTERYTEPEEVHARHILFTVPPDADDKQRDAVRARAAAVLERLKKGEDFAAVAKEVSEDKANKDKGGDLGFIRRGHAEEAFENAAFGLQPGELSAVVETRYGFHIIKVDERKAPARSRSPKCATRSSRPCAPTAPVARRATPPSPTPRRPAAEPRSPSSPRRAGSRWKTRRCLPSTKRSADSAVQPELSKAAFATPTGQIGPVTQVGDALVLFRVREKLPSRVPELADIHDKVETAIRGEQATAKAANVPRRSASSSSRRNRSKTWLPRKSSPSRKPVPFTRARRLRAAHRLRPELKKHAFALSADEPGRAGSERRRRRRLRRRAEGSHSPPTWPSSTRRRRSSSSATSTINEKAAMEALLNQLKRRAKIQINSAALAAI